MKGWIGGLVVGVVLGSAMTGAAQGNWVSVEEIMTSRNIHFKVGYIQGMLDTLTMIEAFRQVLPELTRLGTSSQALPSDTRTLDWLQKQKTCILVHRLGTLEEFLRWTDRVWQTKVDLGNRGANSAGVLLADACNPF